MKSGAFVYSRGFGLANLETRTPVTPSSAFRIGSVSKQFAGAAFALLAEEGKLAFDDPLAKYLPDFPRAADVTLRQMPSPSSARRSRLSQVASCSLATAAPATRKAARSIRT